ncbi:UNVERIFIED_CONTAM: hypothetical protein K2H54_008464 [Gekko kuhli]
MPLLADLQIKALLKARDWGAAVTVGKLNGKRKQTYRKCLKSSSLLQNDTELLRTTEETLVTRRQAKSTSEIQTSSPTHAKEINTVDFAHGGGGELTETEASLQELAIPRKEEHGIENHPQIQIRGTSEASPPTSQFRYRSETGKEPLIPDTQWGEGHT